MSQPPPRKSFRDQSFSIPETITTLTVTVHKRIQSSSNQETDLTNGFTEEWTLDWSNKPDKPNVRVLGTTQATKQMIIDSLHLSQKGTEFEFDDLSRETKFNVPLGNSGFVKELAQNLIIYIMNQEMKAAEKKLPDGRNVRRNTNVDLHEPNNASPNSLFTEHMDTRNPNITLSQNSKTLSSADRLAKFNAILSAPDDEEDDLKPQDPQPLSEDTITGTPSLTLDDQESKDGFVSFGVQEKKKEEVEPPKPPTKKNTRQKKPTGSNQ